jgi:hypothetical protein
MVQFEQATRLVNHSLWAGALRPCQLPPHHAGQEVHLRVKLDADETDGFPRHSSEGMICEAGFETVGLDGFHGSSLRNVLEFPVLDESGNAVRCWASNLPNCAVALQLYRCVLHPRCAKVPLETGR